MTLDRREFFGSAFGTGFLGSWAFSAGQQTSRESIGKELQADVVILGGSLGGCAAAIAALRNGLRVILTEETDWIGGQLTSQAVPPDEHASIETHGANKSYREMRNRIRDYYRRHYPLTEAARMKENLNPGNGNVSRLCHEPRVALAVFTDWLAPYQSGGKLTLLTEHIPVDADVERDQVKAVRLRSLLSGRELVLHAPYFVDATELGDLLPLTNTEFSTGAEAKSETHELHAAETANASNQQAFTMCFAVQHIAGEDHTIEKPAEYAFWREFVPKLTPPWPGKLLDFTYTQPRTGQPRKLGFHPSGGKFDGVMNLWLYRRIADAANFKPGSYAGDISLINWPQNDYLLGNLIGVSEEEKQQHIHRAKQLSLSLLYWLQTEAPRADGGTGFPGLRLRGDLVGTEDGLAKYPYVRESRRIKALLTVREEHVGQDQRAMMTGKSGSELKAVAFPDSIGVGSYAIDLHPSSGGDNYIDFPALPFQVPLGCLIPQRMTNLLPACKNIGVTHLTGGCYRLHPVEWGIGEAVGCLVHYALTKRLTPNAIRESANHLADFQTMLQSQGVEIAWK